MHRLQALLTSNFLLINLFIYFCTDYQLAQRWLKLSSASDGYSSHNTLHGGKIPCRMAGQMVETVWQEYNLNRTGHKCVWALFLRKTFKTCISAGNVTPSLFPPGGSFPLSPTEPVRKNLTRLEFGILLSPLMGYIAIVHGMFW